MGGCKAVCGRVIILPYAFVAYLCADKGCYKHTVFWTLNIKITVHRKVSFYGLFLSETDRKTGLIVDFRNKEVNADVINNLPNQNYKIIRR